MLYTSQLSELFYNLQEPYRFLAFMGMILLFILLLFSNRFIERIELHNRIMTNIREEKAKNPNCCILYIGKIY